MHNSPKEFGRGVTRAYKRPLDLTIIIVAGVLLAPLWLLLGIVIPLAIWLEDGGPVIYRQTRVGLGGRTFQILKFRSMVKDAEAATGPVLVAVDDPRITRVGKLIREFRLDEIPQIMNVIRGDMSLVGPRPERPELMCRFCRELPEFILRLRVRPGIGGLSQVRAPTTPLNLKQKHRYDKFYIEKMSLLLDLKILVLSFLVGSKIIAPPAQRRQGQTYSHEEQTARGADQSTVKTEIC